MIESFLNSSILFQMTFIAYIFAFTAYLVSYAYYIRWGLRQKSLSTEPSVTFSDHRSAAKWTATGLFLLAVLLNISLFIFQWVDSERLPIRTFYETLIYLSLTLSLVFLVVEFFFKVRIFGLLVSAILMGVFLYALTKRDVELRKDLMPALRTPIMIPHVMSYILGYATLFVASISASLYLLKPKGIKGFWVISDEEKVDFSRYTYPITKFAFLFLTFGILLGALWGQIAWANYWGWDPKENWAKLSWLSMVGYFHLKFLKTWDEKKLSWLVIIGGAVILFTYLGMQYLPRDVQTGSLHIYIEE